MRKMLWLVVGVLACTPRPAAVETPTQAGPSTSKPAVVRMTPPFRVRVVRRDQDAQLIEQVVAEDLRRSPLFDVGPAGLVVEVRRTEAGASARIDGLPGGARRSLHAGGRNQRQQAHRLANALQKLLADGPSPFLSEIAFVAGTGDDPRSRQVFVVGYDGGGLRRASRDGRLNILPAWSRGGDLAFTSYARGAPELVVIDAGTRRQQFVGGGGGLNTGAAFSPDGRVIALTRAVDGNTDIYLLSRTGRVLQRLTRHAGIDVSPSWSPDGRQIAFVSDRSGSPQIYLMGVDDADNSDSPRRLTKTGSYNQEPDWCSKHGSTTIAYTRRYPRERYEVHLLDLSSTQDTRLTVGGGKSPSWSPDCRQLVYALESPDSNGLWVITPDGKQRYELWRGRARSPAWSGFNDVGR